MGEILYLNFPRSGHVRAHTEIDQRTALVDCCHSALRDFLGNQTHLERESMRDGKK